MAYYSKNVLAEGCKKEKEKRRRERQREKIKKEKRKIKKLQAVRQKKRVKHGGIYRNLLIVMVESKVFVLVSEPNIFENNEKIL